MAGEFIMWVSVISTSSAAYTSYDDIPGTYYIATGDYNDIFDGNGHCRILYFDRGSGAVGIWETVNESENSIYVGIHMNKFSQAKYSGLQVYYSKNNDDSYGIASKLKSNTRLYLQKDNKREIKGADSSIFILNKIEVPAILIECGFLSNENELNNLKNSDYQAKLALTIFSSLIEGY